MGKKKKQEKEKKSKEKEKKLRKAEKQPEVKAETKKGRKAAEAEPEKAPKPAEKEVPKKKPVAAAREVAKKKPAAVVKKTQSLDRMYQEAAAVFRALGDENRMQILGILTQGELGAGELLQSLSIVQSTLSHHMKILTESGVVQCKRQGKRAYYSINQEVLNKLQNYAALLGAQENT